MCFSKLIFGFRTVLRGGKEKKKKRVNTCVNIQASNDEQSAIAMFRHDVVAMAFKMKEAVHVRDEAGLLISGFTHTIVVRSFSNTVGKGGKGNATLGTQSIVGDAFRGWLGRFRRRCRS